MEQTDFLRYAVEVLNKLKIPYAVVGSFASGAWGESRFTQDIDIVVDLNPLQIDDLCEAFPSPEFYVSKSAAEEAVELASQFNVIHPASGNKIDFMIAGKEAWVLGQIDRSKSVELFEDLKANFAAPEDVILGKLIYYKDGHSEKHLRDIAGILRVSREQIDFDYLTSVSKTVGVEQLWQELLSKIESS